jgi:hypothetical protein
MAERGQSPCLREEIDVDNNSMDDMPHGTNLPPPPKAGELIICQLCGYPIYPPREPFATQIKYPQLFMSKNKKIAKHEYTYHIHYNCQLLACEDLDAKTPGVLAERREFLNELERYRKGLDKA